MKYLYISKEAVAVACDTGSAAEINVGPVSDKEYRAWFKEDFKTKQKICLYYFVELGRESDMAFPKLAFMEEVKAQFPTAQWLPVMDWPTRKVSYFLNFQEAAKRAS